MRIMNDFECGNHHVSEHFVDSSVSSVQCPYCDLLAHRKLAAPRSKLEGITGAFPTAHDRWATVHEQAANVARSTSYYEG
jgi:hypothetical protein